MAMDDGESKVALPFCGDESVCYFGDLRCGLDEPNQQGVIEYLQDEIRVLKELLGKKPRFNDGQRRRLATKGKRLGRKTLDRFACLVTPNALLTWHRRLVAQKYDGSVVCNAGCPPTACGIKELILKLARENRSWGYIRIQGAVANLRHAVGVQARTSASSG